jgi:hypothetical protein
MQSQDNPMIQMNSGDKSQPLNPGQYYPLYPNQNSPQAQPYQNPQTDQYYQSPQQIQNPNNNLTNAQQIGPSNQLSLAKGNNSNKIVIPFNFGVNFFYAYLIISGIIIIYLIPSDAKVLLGIFLAIEIVIHLGVGRNSIEISKDELKRKLYVRVANNFFCYEKSLEFDLENVILNAITNGGNNVLVVINNYKKNGGMDSYMNEINNKPAYFFYHFRNINLSRFNGVIDFNNLLDNFIGLQRNQENPLNFNIYSYMKQNLNQNYLFQEINIKYLKINEHFFTYFNVNPVLSSKYDYLAFKITSFIFHYIVILEYVHSYIFLNQEYSLFDNSENILIYVGFDIFLLIVCFFICLLMKSDYNYIRIDIIFSNDYNKLFIGVSQSSNLLLYTAKYEFFLNTLDRFLLENNPRDKRSLDLKVKNKQTHLTTTICTIRATQKELEGLLYLLNERINNNSYNNMNIDNNINSYANILVNNNQQKVLNEYPLQPTV